MQRIEIQVVIVIFVESNYILPKNITNTVEEYSFTYLPMIKREKDVIKNYFIYI